MPASRCGRSGKFFHAELRRRRRDAGAAVGEYRAREPEAMAIPVMLRRDLCCATRSGPGIPLFSPARAAHNGAAVALKSFQEGHQ
jgi:hypothetical protein